MPRTDKKLKIAYFGNSTSYVSNIMFNELVKLLKHRKDAELVAVIDAAKEGIIYRLNRQDIVTALLRHAVAKLFNPMQDIPFDYHGDFITKAHRMLLRYQVMKASDINSKEFNEQIKATGANVALSVVCPQCFSQNLIDSFDYCVNYHNGKLPEYRGVCPPVFAIMNNESYSRYTFHFMLEKIDSGNILVQGITPLKEADNSRSSMVKMAIKETYAASKQLDTVIDCLVSGKQGQVQYGKPHYYGLKEWNQLLRCNDSSIEQARHKLILCGYIVMEFKGQDVYVTNIKENNGKPIISRIYYLPIWLWKLLLRIGIGKRFDIAK